MRKKRGVKKAGAERRQRLQAGRPADELRARAEAILSVRRPSAGRMVSRLSLVQELQTHQVELELQNEELRAAQLALAHTNDRLSDLYEHAPVGYLTLDESGTILGANLRAAAMLGVPREDLAGQTLHALVARESQDVLHAHLRSLFDHEAPQTCVLERQNAGGTTLTLQVESELSRGSTSDAPQCRSALIDVTERRQAETLSSAVNAINWIVHSSRRMGDIMQAALENAEAALGCDSVVASLKRGDKWEVSYTSPQVGRAQAQETTETETESGIALALRVHQPVAIGDVRTDLRASRTRLSKWGVRSCLIVPLILRDQPVGLVLFGWQKPRSSFADSHVDFAVKLGATLALAMENVQLVESLQKEVDEGKRREARLARVTRLYAVLSRVNEAIVRVRRRDLLLGEVCRIIADEGGFPLVWIGEVKGRAVEPGASAGSAVGYLQEVRVETDGPLSLGPTGTCLREDRAVINEDYGTNPQVAPWRPVAERYGFGSSAAFPLHQGGAVSGSLTLCATERRGFDEERVQLLQALAADLSYALDAMEQDRRRAEAEQALRESERRVKLIVDTIADGFYALDREWRFTHLNDAALRYFHKTREEMLGQTLLSLFPGVEGSIFETEYRRALQSGQPVHFEAQSVVSGRTIEIHAYPGVENLTVLFHDATERSALQRALQRSETLYRAIARNLPDAAVWVVDSDLKCLVIEGSLVPHLGWARERIEGLRLPEAIQAETLMPVEEPFRQALAGTTASYETPYGERMLWTQYAPLKDEVGNVIGAMGLALDITERTRLQNELIQLNEDLERLVSRRTDALRESVQHLKAEVTLRGQAEAELRAAKDALELRAAQLHALALELTRAEERERRRVAEILHDDLQQLLLASCMHVKALEKTTAPEQRAAALRDLGAVLDEAFQSSRSLSHELHPPALRSGKLRDALLWLAERTERRHGLKVDVVAPPRLKVDSEMVRTLVFRAVQELLFNVVKHAETREVEVSAMREGERLRVTVADRGRGFDAGALGKSAAGLGLTRLRERVELLGGALTVDSAPGQGCRISMLLPTRETGAEQPAAAAAARDDAPHERRRAGARPVDILLADDHEAVRQGLMSLLEDEPDLRVVGQAQNGLEAVELAGRLKPDVVIMDVTMPLLDGVEATRQIHERAPNTRVIGLSVLSEAEVGQRMHAAGASAFLSKTASSQQLLDAIRTVRVASGREAKG